MTWPIAIRYHLRKLRALSPDERWTLARLIFLLPATALTLRLASFKRCQSVLAGFVRARPAEGQKNDDETIQKARSVARLVRLAARRNLFRINCLPQALILWWLLKRQGIESELRIGVRKGAAPFEAHAWVEVNGVALNEAADLHERFQPFEGAVLPAQIKF